MKEKKRKSSFKWKHSDSRLFEIVTLSLLATFIALVVSHAWTLGCLNIDTFGPVGNAIELFFACIVFCVYSWFSIGVLFYLLDKYKKTLTITVVSTFLLWLINMTILVFVIQFFYRNLHWDDIIDVMMNFPSSVDGISRADGVILYFTSKMMELLLFAQIFNTVYALLPKLVAELREDDLKRASKDKNFKKPPMTKESLMEGISKQVEIYLEENNCQMEQEHSSKTESVSNPKTNRKLKINHKK